MPAMTSTQRWTVPPSSCNAEAGLGWKFRIFSFCSDHDGASSPCSGPEGTSQQILIELPDHDTYPALLQRIRYVAAILVLPGALMAALRTLLVVSFVIAPARR